MSFRNKEKESLEFPVELERVGVSVGVMLHLQKSNLFGKLKSNHHTMRRVCLSVSTVS